MFCLNKITKTTFFLFFISFLVAPSVFAANILQNGDFSSSTGWTFYKDEDSVASGSIVNGEYTTTITTKGDNIQLYQKNFELSPLKQYRVSFDAKSSRQGSSIQVAIQKHESNYSNYGFNENPLLNTTLQTFSYVFTPTITQVTTDTRLWINFSAAGVLNGDIITIDNVLIEEVTANDANEEDQVTLLRYDFNGDEKENILDLVDIIKYVFNGGA